MYVRKALTVIVGLSFLVLEARAEVWRDEFPHPSSSSYLIVEILDDDLVHVEVSAHGPSPGADRPIAISPMVFKSDYDGPESLHQDGDLIETDAMVLKVNRANLCLTVWEKTDQGRTYLTTICPVDLDKDWKGLNVDPGGTEHVYGLGQQFKTLGSADGDWTEHGQRQAQPEKQDQAHGNGFMGFGSAGQVGNVQIPVMYAVGGDANYGLFLDNVYKQSWKFDASWWEVRMWGDQVRYYLMTGPNLRDLRRDYLELAGTPPVPPRKAFGLWVSEFGYRSWDDMDRLATELRERGFPVDGFVLDLFWFGGIKKKDPDSPMGRLAWDTQAFPNPAGRIAAYLEDHLGLVAIEESYVSLGTNTYQQMDAQYFARQSGNPGRPTVLSEWFGEAAMIDWSHPLAGAWIHEHRRFPNLVRKGILGHWTDLGEPEKYDEYALYHGVEETPQGRKNEHGDVHNIYNLLWNRSIYDGYYQNRAEVNRRPFIMTRSGTAGTQRFGAAVWSGDIGSSLELLATHCNAQLHMSLSGIDYYGADIGGFRREGLPYNEEHAHLQYEDDLYTQWFANGAWFDVPVRPHTDNSFQASRQYDTSPHLVGDAASNLANIRQRYELTPYYYSLAHRAYREGEPLIPPLVYYYQDDRTVRRMGHQKMIGPSLMVAVVARHGEYQRDVYLPRGKWVHYHSREWVTSTGQWLRDVPVYRDGLFRLPVLARAGAILPQMLVDENTKDVFGHRKTGSGPRDELVVMVFADAEESSFVLHEDDGSTLEYDARRRPVYRARTTRIRQQQGDGTVTVTVEPAEGAYPGAVESRGNLVRLVVDAAEASRVTLEDEPLPPCEDEEAFRAAESGWCNADRNLILAKSAGIDVAAPKTFRFELQPRTPAASVYFVGHQGWTRPGEEIYVVGSIEALGRWDPAKGLKMEPSVYHEYIYHSPPNHNGPGPSSPTWTRVVSGLPPNTIFEWKLALRRKDGTWKWQPGPNNVHVTLGSGYSGAATASF